MNTLPFVILCRAVRTTTNSQLTFPIPMEYDTPEKAVDYVGNLLSWQFIPMKFDIVTPEAAAQELSL